MRTPPSIPKIGIEEIDHSPLHHRLAPLGLRRMLVRMRQQMAELGVINRLSKHVRAVVGIADFDKTNQ